MIEGKMSDQFQNLTELEDSPYLNPINRPLMVDEVIDRLIALVVSENLKPGDKLPTERELMAKLAIGRSTLREAIKTLSAVGALEVKRSSGIIVGHGDSSILAKPLAWGMFLSRSSVGEVIEARRVIEAALAGWAAERRTAEDLSILDTLIEMLEKNQNNKHEYIEYDLRFHLAIANAARNKILRQVLNIFQHLLRVWMQITYDETQGPRDSMIAHHKLIEAIHAKDPESARQIMQDHISGAPLHAILARQNGDSEIMPDFLSLIRGKKH